MINLQNQSVLITGRYGFLGKQIEKILVTKGTIIQGLPKSECDLRDKNQTETLFYRNKPDYVLNLAGFNGGIVFNKQNPSQIFNDNVQMGLNVLNACKTFNVKKVISVMASCAYPDTGKEILYESEFWDGPCNPTVECHGLAKRTLEAYSRFLHQQYNFPAYTICLTNLYGPGDRFNERGKVVSMLIQKFIKAKEKNLSSVEILGSGVALRDLMYVEDAAQAVIKSLEFYNNSNFPLNIGTGKDISIKNLVNMITNMVGYKGEVTWNIKAGDGQIKKLLDITRMRKILNYEPETKFEDGLRNTIDWYRENQEM
jgi:GDP-L-fucose synthase